MKTLKISSFIIFLLSIIVITYAQAPDTMWTKTFGGTGNGHGFSIQETDDGGFIVTGLLQTTGSNWPDVWLLKTDAAGDTVWTKTFGGIDFDCGYSVTQTLDGGYVLAGETFDIAGRKVLLIKTNSIGNTLWTKTYGDGQECGNSVQQTFDGGFIIGGYTAILGSYSDVWLLKTDSNGDTLWTKTYGGDGAEWGNSVYQTSDSGYIIIGLIDSTNMNMWIVKTDSNGDTVWTKSYGGFSSEEGFCIKETMDNGYIIVGRTRSFGNPNSDKLWLIKTNSLGDTLWTRVYGIEGIGRNSLGFSVNLTNDGGFIITGYTRFVIGDYDLWILKTDTMGDTLWTKTMGGMEYDDGRDVKQCNDNGYIITGCTSAKLWIVKLKPDSPNVIIDYDDIISSKFLLDQNYPNPFNPSTKIKYSIPYSSKTLIVTFDE